MNEAVRAMEWLASRLTPLDMGLILIAGLLLAVSFFLFRSESDRARARIFRLLNLMVIAFVIGYHLVASSLADSWVLRLASVLAVIYLAYLSMLVSAWFVRRRFGRERTIGDERQIIETYHSRLLTLVIGTVIGLVALVAIVRILGFTSLLEAGGVLGVIGVMLAITQAAWAPDIISGLIILNSSLVEEGDVVQFDDPAELPMVVFKTKLFHTELLNLANNHRIMLRNAHLRDRMIHNLSKFASARGLRELLRFRIGYEVPPDRVEAFFEGVARKAAESGDIGLEPEQPVEVRVLDTGDHAVEWGVYYYTKQVRDLLQIRQQMRAQILRESLNAGLSLATPLRVALVREMEESEP